MSAVSTDENPSRATGDRERFSGRRYTLRRGLGIVFEDAPGAAATRVAVALAAGLASGPFMVLAIERFITTALEAAQGQLPAATVAVPVAVLLALFAVELLQTGVRTVTDARIEAGLRRGLRVDLTEKRARLAYRYVEHPETMDLIRRVQAGPPRDPDPAPERGPVKQAFDDLMEVAGLTVRIIGITAVLARIGWWIIPVVIAIVVPTVLMGAGGGRRVYRMERRLAVLERRAEYLSGGVLQGRDSAAERTLFGYSKYVNNLWRSAFDKERLLSLRINTRVWFHYRAATVFVIGAIIAAMVALLQPLRAGIIDLAFYTAAAVTLLQAENLIATHLVQITSRIARFREFLVDLTSFSQLEERAASLTRRPPREAIERIEFDRVGFTYPGAGEPVLEAVSFSLQAGRHYALVGANGSGKSTIIKLMVGLYRPTAGAIRINGTPIEEWPQDALNGLYGIVYQDFARYALTVRDNVAFGSLARTGGPPVEEILQYAGLEDLLRKLPRGVDSPLGKVLADGVDVSGGEWQRLAIARSLASAAPVRILDEPTAALDPLAESDLYQRYAQASADVTTLFISHRLGSTKIADEILLLDDGAIAESGTHAGLMEQGGLYARMFETQMHWYGLP